MEDAQSLAGLYEIIQQNTRQDYPRIIEQSASYPYLYHLSEVRCNLTDWLPLERHMNVLERNAGCGALTGNLLGKAGQVTCVAEDAPRADLIKMRWASEGESRLHVITEEEWKTKSRRPDGQFDMILLAGDFWRFREELPALRGLLKDTGCLIVADANRLGLKYFAGCQEEYQGGYFTGIENSVSGSGRSFSRAEYSTFLRDAGFSELRFYYPYPDHKFPSAIYSEDRLPGPGELSENRRNFDRDRLLLFDESRAYDTLVAEGMFGEFANSFLIMAGKNPCGSRERLLYAKFSGERDRRFAIRTEIVAEASGGRAVYKTALYPEGEAHISHICSMYEKLSESYAGSEIDFCACERTGRGARFAYVEGSALADALKTVVYQGDRAAVEKILAEYIRRVGSAGGNIPFQRTEEFLQVFGPSVPEAGMDCAYFCDIDMIFSNILLPEGEVWEQNARWTVIDYEWTFAFPIPKAFVLYRGLYFVYHQFLGGMGWGFHELLALADITEAQAQTFAAMEVHFQSYLGQGALSVRNMQRRIGTRIFPLEELLAGGDAAFGTCVPESEWIKVRRIVYHIDRTEFQDGSMICSGWAFAMTRDGRSLPVDIRVTDAQGRSLPAEVSRTERPDVARQLKLRAVTRPIWGFDCVWLTQPGAQWRIHFSLGNRKKFYEP